MADYGLIGKFTAHPGQRDALVQLLLEAARVLETADGCKQWFVHEPTADTDGVWVTEVWTDREAHDASLELQEVRDVIERAMPLIAGPAEGFETVPRGGVQK